MSVQMVKAFATPEKEVRKTTSWPYANLASLLEKITLLKLAVIKKMKENTRLKLI